VFDQNDPETWNGKEGDVCRVDERILNENGVWNCPHDAADDEELCLFHLPVANKDDERVSDAFVDVLDEVSERDTENTGSRPSQFLGAQFGEFDLSGDPPEIVAKDAEIVLDHIIVEGKLDWSEAIFEVAGMSMRGIECTENFILSFSEFCGETDFEGAKFCGKADFGGAEFHGMAAFRSTEFHGEADFFNSEFLEVAIFRSAMFHEEADFGCVGSDEVDFYGSEWDKKANFRRSELGSRTRFGHAKFGGKADFPSVEFDGEANFGSVEFDQEVNFQSAEFCGEANFSSAEFRGEVQFLSTEFGQVNFFNAEFCGEVGFNSTEFRGDAEFPGTEWRKKVSFDSTEFCGEAVLRSAKFCGEANFGDVEFRGETVFRYAEFHGPAVFFAVKFGGEVIFESTKFKHILEFSESVFEEGPDFSHFESLSGARFDNADLTDAVFTGVTLHNTNFQNTLLSRATLLGTDLRGAKLSGAVLGDVRIDKDTQFLGTPDDDSNSSPHTISAIRSTPRCVYDPNYRRDNDWIDVDNAKSVSRLFEGLEANDEVDMDKAERIYQKLNKMGTNDESDKDKAKIIYRKLEELAANGETDVDKAKSVYRTLEELAGKAARPRLQSQCFVRRQELQKDNYKQEAKEANSWQERLIASARYSRAKVARETLLYGESPWRIIGGSIGFIIFVALLYPLGEWLRPMEGEPITYSRILGGEPGLLLESLYFSTLTFTTLGMGDYEPIGLGQALATLNTIFGAVLIALLVFVLGRQAAR